MTRHTIRSIRHLIADELDRRGDRRRQAWSDQYEKLRTRGLIDHDTAMRHLTGCPTLALRIANLEHTLADLIRP